VPAPLRSMLFAWQNDVRHFPMHVASWSSICLHSSIRCLGGHIIS